ncbi:MAG: glycosyltransferase [Terrimicrobiaceae bacterium]|nr:glycosyltransferase [Terrimicrobiaceae bacterium]
MQSKRIMVLSASVGSGHMKAADALEKAFRAHPLVGEVFSDDSLDHTNPLHKQFYSGLYKRLSEITPNFLGWWYETSDDPWATDRVRLLIDLPQALPLVNLIRDFQPDHIVCTHFMPAGVIAHLLRRKQLETKLSIVVTDYHFHAMWLARAFHHYFVAQDEDKIHMEALGLPGDRITVSGIPVDPAFEQPVDREAVLARHGLDPARPLLLISGGTLGLSPAAAVVKRLRGLDLPFQALVICGKNEDLHAKVTELVADDADRFRVIGYTAEMRDLMGAATLILTKPGGLTTAEALASGLPMVILDPIGGQEERNADMLLENGAAIKCTEVTVLAHKLGMLLGDPERLAAMSANARRLGRPDAARVIADTVLYELQPEPRRISRRDEKKFREAITEG